DFALQGANRAEAHRHFIFQRDRPRFDARVMDEFARNRVAEPLVAEYPWRLERGNCGDADALVLRSVHRNSELDRLGRSAAATHAALAELRADHVDEQVECG